ncbi:trigger factor [Candidatus Saccharibacteria bacterium]|nr:MAG: trigger factor [Candidatus Saccharibacteria bacterium]
MQTTLKNLSSTKLELTIAADEAQLAAVKDRVLDELAKDVNMAGFRKGHAPKALIEKNVDQATLQTRFLDVAVNELYVQAVTDEKLRPVQSPEVAIKKFVPFTTLEIKATFEAVGKITLGDYKKTKVTPKTVKVTKEDIQAVLEDLQHRDAEKKDVDRASKDGDEIVIDFTGTDPKTKKPFDGGTATDYPLIIGSNTFIPGFEPELVGLKKDDKKDFDIAFPKDYGNKDLAGKKVNFAVTVKAVREVVLPKLDDAFAAKVGPFKTVAELKADIERQIASEKDNQAQRELENEVLATLAEKSKAEIPGSLIEEEMDRMEAEEKRNLLYRGQTWAEHLKAEGKTEEEHRESHREQAEARVKTGLVLGEVAEAEGITVTEKELDERIASLKQQYASDKQMQTELDKPENRREIASRILTEKTVENLVSYATK